MRGPAAAIDPYYTWLDKSKWSESVSPGALPMCAMCVYVCVDQLTSFPHVRNSALLSSSCSMSRMACASSRPRVSTTITPWRHVQCCQHTLTPPQLWDAEGARLWQAKGGDVRLLDADMTADGSVVVACGGVDREFSMFRVLDPRQGTFKATQKENGQDRLTHGARTPAHTNTPHSTHARTDTHGQAHAYAYIYAIY